MIQGKGCSKWVYASTLTQGRTTATATTATKKKEAGARPLLVAKEDDWTVNGEQAMVIPFLQERTRGKNKNWISYNVSI